MTLTKRIVVTGMGWVTPLGNSLESAWAAMLSGKSGVSKNSLFNASSFPTTFAAEVKNFDLRTDVKDAYKYSKATRRTQFLLAAASQAWSQAGANLSGVDKSRIGLYLANGEGALDFETYAQCCIRAWDQEANRMDFVRWSREALREFDPILESEHDPSSASRHLANMIGAAGPSFNTLTACAASLQAMGEAMAVLRRGDADVMLAGGANSMIHPLGVTGFCRLTALSNRNDSPQAASRPFDLHRNGFVLGEGAGIVVLETLEHAQRRGAVIVGELAGYGCSADAYRVTDQHPESRGMIHAMQCALQSAEVKPEQIDYINAHGTGTRENDRQETAAIHAILGDRAKQVPISSLKSMIGHLITAAGVVELIASLLSLRDGIVPPTINLDSPDPECDLDYVPHTARRTKLDVVLTNNAGFGGQNSALVIRRVASSTCTSLPQRTTQARRVVVTGLGVVSPFGVGANAFWSGLETNSCAIKRLTRFNPDSFGCQIAGEVPPFSLADHIPNSYRKSTKLMARDIALAVVAASEAMKSAEFSRRVDEQDNETFDNRFSCHIGTGTISAEVDELAPALFASSDGFKIDLERWGAEGLKHLTPIWLLKYLPNMLASHLTILHGLTGSSNTITVGDVSGYLSIGEAFRAIERGDADRALCGGIESQINPQSFVRQILAARINDSANGAPDSAVAPFRDAANGTILGEGGALLVLESLDSAIQRHATIFAEVTGFACSQECEPPSEQARENSYSLSIEHALNEANVKIGDVDLVIPRGTGVVSEDRFEWSALQHVFGDRISDLLPCLPKKLIGDLGAGNAIDGAAAVLSVKHGRLPSKDLSEPVETVLCCSSSRFGQNAAIVFRSFAH